MTTQKIKSWDLYDFVPLYLKFNVTFSLSRSIKDIFPEIMLSFQIVGNCATLWKYYLKNIIVF